jgi:hypothetical protein
MYIEGWGCGEQSFTLMWFCNMWIHTVSYRLSFFTEENHRFQFLFFFNAESNNHWFQFFQKTLNKNQGVSWKNRQFFNCLGYFWESHSSCIEFNSSNILRTNQWASEYIPELITNRYLTLFLRTTQHWFLGSHSLIRTLAWGGGAWACFSSPFGTFFLRDHPGSCSKNLLCSHECALRLSKLRPTFLTNLCFQDHFS